MKLAYTGIHFPKEIQKSMQDYVKKEGYHLDIIDRKSRDLWDSKEGLRGYDVVISAGETFGKETIAYLLPTLKVISRHGIGTDEIDKDFATENGIAVCNAAGTLSSCVAECALALILNTLHDYVSLDMDVREGRWGENGRFTSELKGKTVGLLGFGGIGSALAKFLRAFDCEILAFDPYFNKEVGQKLDVKQVTLEEMCVKSDIISIHAPLSKETRGMVDMAFLQKMKRSAILINTSRGDLIKEEDLINALATGIIAGAGLDVFAKEPINLDNPLLKLKNVTLLPHVASHTYDSQLEAGLMACRNAIAIIEGREPESLLNPAYRRMCTSANMK